MVKAAPLRLPGFHPTAFFRKLSQIERSVAYFTSGDWTVIAWNPRRTWTGQSLSLLGSVKASMPAAHRKTDLPFLGGVIGWISYDAGRMALGVRSMRKKSVRMPEVCFHRYDTAILWNGKRLLAVGDATFRASVRAIHARPLVGRVLPRIAWARGMNHAAYAKAFRAVMRGIRSGDFYQLNLTFPFTAESDAGHRTLFAALLDANPASSASYIEHGRAALVSASPERFVLIDNGAVTTCPIKGTRPRGATPAEDRARVAELLRSPKEQAELNMITDLLRNDIGKISEPGSVRVRGYRLLQKNPSVWHTYSVIEGALRPGLHPLDALASMSPPGSVTGCPKVAAMEEIDRLESSRRGLYCGSAVMLSAHGRLDSTVLIRTVACDGDRFALGVGGGIVADSVLKDEESEAEKKAERILQLPVRRVWINGRETQDDRRLFRLDPTSASARGLFETMRADNGRIHHLTRHLGRLRRSARSLGLRIPSDRTLRTQLQRAVTAGGRGVLRVKLVLSGTDTIIETGPLVTDHRSALGITVTYTRLSRSTPAHKCLPYHREWGAYENARSEGFGETLLVSPDGTVPESAVSNIFIVRKGILYTPNRSMLPGITRSVLLSLARKLRIRVIFSSIRLRDIRNADEVFLSRSLSGVLPVIRVRSTTIGKGKPGPITRKLQKAFSGTLSSDA